MITVRNLTKNYDNFNLDISLEIPEGRVTGIIGRNGAGKSTTIKAILGLIKRDSGEISVLGADPSGYTAADKEKIGVCLADSAFSMYLNIEDISKVLTKLYREFDKEEFLKNCKEWRLPLDKQIKEFSTGMKVKLKVLVAMSHNAKVLIMDEPTAGLDVERRGEVLDMIREYLGEDDERSVLISSHIAGDLESICDDIYLIADGKVILHEDTDVLLSEYGLIKISEDEYQKLDKEYILASKKENFGYSCITNQKQYYIENYPGMVVENSGIDNLVLMVKGAEK